MLNSVIHRRRFALDRTRERFLAAMHGLDRRPFLGRQALVPAGAQRFPAHGVILVLARERPQLRLAPRVGDAALGRRFFDLGGSPREAFEHGRRNARDLEIIALALDGIAQVLQLTGQPHAHDALEIWRIAFEVAELPCLPPRFLIVIGGVEDEAVGVQLRIGHAIDRPGGGVNELGPGHIAGDAVGIFPAAPVAGFDFRFDVAHGFIDRLAEGPEQFRIGRLGIEQRQRLRA